MRKKTATADGMRIKATSRGASSHCCGTTSDHQGRLDLKDTPILHAQWPCSLVLRRTSVFFLSHTPPSSFFLQRESGKGSRGLFLWTALSTFKHVLLTSYYPSPQPHPPPPRPPRFAPGFISPVSGACLFRDGSILRTRRCDVMRCNPQAIEIEGVKWNSPYRKNSDWKLSASMTLPSPAARPKPTDRR